MKKLVAKDGYVYMNENGDYSKIVILGGADSEENWKEVPEPENEEE